nr:hybrid sensor histidine kinase/response regulator [Jannaschia sp. S6380]
MSDVIGGLRLIDIAALPRDARTQVDRVHAASELLARLVEELLGSAPSDESDHVGNLNLLRFLDDEVRRWRGAAHGTGIEVALDCAPDLPATVRVGLLPLRRIVANMMSNALRHAGAGQVRLGAELYDDGALSICVSDDGPGFDPEILPNVFDAEARGSDAAPGMGMGLHIARAHADQLGGRLVAENRNEGGARVTLTLPRARWQRHAPDADGLPDLSNVRVLVADDSATNRTLVQGMLAQMGAECELAADGIEALNWLARERFDIALIDLEMPTLGGLEVMRSERLRQARGIAPPMSMVAMTSHDIRENRDLITEAGADGILAKPLGSIQTFGQTIRHFVAAGPDASGWAPELAPAFSAATLSDLMSAAGPEYRDQLLARMREDLQMVERHLTNALSMDDVEAVHAQTHILLSLATAVGALPTLSAARRLNHAARSGRPEATRAAGRVCLARLAALRADLDQAL